VADLSDDDEERAPPSASRQGDNGTRYVHGLKNARRYSLDEIDQLEKDEARAKEKRQFQDMLREQEVNRVAAVREERIHREAEREKRRRDELEDWMRRDEARRIERKEEREDAERQRKEEREDAERREENRRRDQREEDQRREERADKKHTELLAALLQRSA